MYLSFYGLREEPFRLTPDPRFFHLAEPHRDALTALMRGVLFRKGFMMLTGPVGTGKTTLLHTLLQILTERFFPENRMLSAFLLNPTLSRDEFLEALLEEFEIDCSSTTKPRRLQVLYQALLDTQRRKGTALLVIDEAHLLTLELLEEIRLLSNMDTYREKPLQIILCGQTELLSLLAKPETRALQQRIADRCQLRAMSLPETRAYVAERLHAAGLRGPAPFPSPTLEEIHRVTQGVPRLINLLCDGCLMIGMNTNRKQIQLDILEEAATALGMNARTDTSAAPDCPVAPQRHNQTAQSAVEALIETIRQARANVRMEP